MLHGVRVQVSPSAPQLGYSQVGKAAGFDPAIRRFESCYPSHFFLVIALLLRGYHLGYSQVGKAAGFDPAIRRFESCYPSQTSFINALRNPLVPDMKLFAGNAVPEQIGRAHV